MIYLEKMDKKYMDTEGVCKFLTLTKKQLDWQCQMNDLPYYRMGNGQRAMRRFKTSEVIAWLEKGRVVERCPELKV